MVDTNYEPNEREKIAKVLRQNSAYTESEIQEIVEFLQQLAPALLKIWTRVASEKTK